MKFVAVVIPHDLASIDERCKIWARVCRDRPRRVETPIYRAMCEWGGYRPEPNSEDPEPLPPLTQEQTRDAWLIERAWRHLPPRFQNPLLLWYFVSYAPLSAMRRTLQCNNRMLLERLKDSLHAIENKADLLSRREQ